MKKFFRNWGAAIICFLIFLGSLLGQFVSQIAVAEEEAKNHNQEFSLVEVWPDFFAATLENWQSEFLQLTFQSVLIASVAQRYIFRADFSADKDDVTRLEEKLDKLLEERNKQD
jgi:ABC-type Fe3+ transport system permease subunit